MLQLLTLLQPPWSFGWWGVVCVSKWAACVADTPWYIINSCQTPGTGSSSSLLNVRLSVDPRHSPASSPVHTLPTLSFLFLLLRLLIVQQQQQHHLWLGWCLHHRDFSLPLHHINQSVPAAHEWAKKTAITRFGNWNRSSSCFSATAFPRLWWPFRREAEAELSLTTVFSRAQKK